MDVDKNGGPALEGKGYAVIPQLKMNEGQRKTARESLHVWAELICDLFDHREELGLAKSCAEEMEN